MRWIGWGRGCSGSFGADERRSSNTCGRHALKSSAGLCDAVGVAAPATSKQSAYALRYGITRSTLTHSMLIDGDCRATMQVNVGLRVAALVAVCGAIGCDVSERTFIDNMGGSGGTMSQQEPGGGGTSGAGGGAGMGGGAGSGNGGAGGSDGNGGSAG